MMNSRSNKETSKGCKRGESYVRDGYLITIEEIYHVNGRKKKKVKKRRLKQHESDSENQPDQAPKENDKLMQLQQINIEKELRAIKEIGQQTRELEARKKLQSQASPTIKLATSSYT